MDIVDLGNIFLEDDENWEETSSLLWPWWPWPWPPPQPECDQDYANNYYY